MASTVCYSPTTPGLPGMMTMSRGACRGWDVEAANKEAAAAEAANKEAAAAADAAEEEAATAEAANT